jgi:hypothetical protein
MGDYSSCFSLHGTILLILVDSFDHQWTFQREFHVSPFNDRTGYYTVSVKAPSHPPNFVRMPGETVTPPRPIVRVHVHTAPPDSSVQEPGPLKLSALLRPTISKPLTAFHVITTLLQAPLSLFLSLPRILFEAWKLHYRKRLDVFIRPEPLPPITRWRALKSLVTETRPSGSLGWRSETLFEGYARKRVESFLQKRVAELGVKVTLIPFNTALPINVYGNSQVQDQKNTLNISYSASRFFSILYLSPSANHALLLGCDTEGIFSVSSRDLFLKVFGSHSQSQATTRTQRQIYRTRVIPTDITYRSSSAHPLDRSTAIGSLIDTAVIRFSLWLDQVEASVFRITGARIVTGDEPWKMWDRAAQIHVNGAPLKTHPDHGYSGSIRRE